MNKLFISGLINEAPVFRMEQGDIPHLILSLSAYAIRPALARCRRRPTA